MGTRGPIPGRSEVALGHNSKAEREAITKAPGAEVVEVPEPDQDWHPTAYRWYTSLALSGQSRFYEPSDWATAYYLADCMSINLRNSGRFSAQLVAAVMAGMSTLLVTEGDRRRAQMELQRVTAPEEKTPTQVAREQRLRLATG